MFSSYSEVSIKNPDNSGQVLPLTYVCCREQAEDGACWHLLTSEKVASAADARRIVSHYERCWLIEEYHKAWKRGERVWNHCECRRGITSGAWWLSGRLSQCGCRVCGREVSVKKHKMTAARKYWRRQSRNCCGLSWKESGFRRRHRP